MIRFTPIGSISSLSLLLAGMVLAVSITGCASSETNADSAPKPSVTINPEEHLHGEWTLTALHGRSIAETLAGGELRSAPTMTISDDGRLSGFSGVNRYAGPVLNPDSLVDGRFAVGPLVSTKMAGPPAAMRMENDFFDALDNATAIDSGALAEGRLILRDSTGTELLRFTRAE